MSASCPKASRLFAELKNSFSMQQLAENNQVQCTIALRLLFVRYVATCCSVVIITRSVVFANCCYVEQEFLAYLSQANVTGQEINFESIFVIFDNLYCQVNLLIAGKWYHYVLKDIHPLCNFSLHLYFWLIVLRVCCRMHIT